LALVLRLLGGYGLAHARIQEVSEGEKHVQEAVRADCDDIIRSGGSVNADEMPGLYDFHEKRTESNKPVSGGMQLLNDVCRGLYLAEEVVTVESLKRQITDLEIKKELQIVEVESKRPPQIAEMPSKQELGNFSNGAIPSNLKVGSGVHKFGSLEPKKEVGGGSSNNVPINSKLDTGIKKLDGVSKSSEVKVVDIDTSN
jgi:hypothetical protein